MGSARLMTASRTAAPLGSVMVPVTPPAIADAVIVHSNNGTKAETKIRSRVFMIVLPAGVELTASLNQLLTSFAVIFYRVTVGVGSICSSTESSVRIENASYHDTRLQSLVAIRRSGGIQDPRRRRE